MEKCDRKDRKVYCVKALSLNNSNGEIHVNYLVLYSHGSTINWNLKELRENNIKRYKVLESLWERWIAEVCFLGKNYKKFVLEGCREKIDFLIPICNSAVFVSTFLKRQGGAAGGGGVERRRRQLER